MQPPPRHPCARDRTRANLTYPSQYRGPRTAQRLFLAAASPLLEQADCGSRRDVERLDRGIDRDPQPALRLTCRGLPQGLRLRRRKATVSGSCPSPSDKETPLRGHQPRGAPRRRLPPVDPPARLRTATAEVRSHRGTQHLGRPKESRASRGRHVPHTGGRCGAQQCPGIARVLHSVEVDGVRVERRAGGRAA